MNRASSALQNHGMRVLYTEKQAIKYVVLDAQHD